MSNKPKIRAFTGTKKCLSGETYRFTKGVAVVPGFRMGPMVHRGGIAYPVKITLKEFKELNHVDPK